jgi:general secretion pathway protein N
LRPAIYLAAAGFALGLIISFPARWLGPVLPHAVHCRQLQGTAWSGTCTGLSTGARELGDLSWELHALQLLRARLDLQLDLTDQGNYLRGDIAFGFGGALHGRDVQLDLPLTSALISSLPAGAQAHLSGKLARIEWTGKFISVLQGQLDVRDLIAAQGEVFGNYQAIFAPNPAADNADTPTGVIHDSGGPLELDGTLQLTHDPGYVMQGRVAARASASSGLADDLKYLGSADATGRRAFSLQGTF